MNGKDYPAAVSIGTTPTFGENARQIEAHIVGFDGDLYGKTIAVELLDWIHEQLAFTGVEPLKAQIKRDIIQTVAASGRDFSQPIASTTVPASNRAHFA